MENLRFAGYYIVDAVSGNDVHCRRYVDADSEIAEINFKGILTQPLIGSDGIEINLGVGALLEIENDGLAVRICNFEDRRANN